MFSARFLALIDLLMPNGIADLDDRGRQMVDLVDNFVAINGSRYEEAAAFFMMLTILMKFSQDSLGDPVSFALGRECLLMYTKARSIEYGKMMELSEILRKCA